MPSNFNSLSEVQLPQLEMNISSPEAPIGVFDSGVGGLSVLHAVRRELPNENLLYLADSGNAPYGDRETGFITDRATLITEFLVAHGVKAIVVACHTVTTVAIARLRSWCPVPIVAVEPAIKPATACTKSGVVGVLATSQTLASSAVVRLCATYGGDTKILLQPCPGLAEQVESGELTSSATRALLLKYIAPLLAAGTDTIVLGCTHYPFLVPLIREIIGPDISLIDPANAVARELARRLGTNRMPMFSDTSANERFFSSGPIEQARSVISALWGRSVEVHSFSTPWPCDASAQV